MSNVVIYQRAAKYVRKLPNPQKSRVKKLLGQLQNDPLNHPQASQMAGNWAGYH